MLVQWFRLQHPKQTKCLFAIPNGGVRNIGTAIKLKREGVVPGVGVHLEVRGEVRVDQVERQLPPGLDVGVVVDDQLVVVVSSHVVVAVGVVVAVSVTVGVGVGVAVRVSVMVGVGVLVVVPVGVCVRVKLIVGVDVRVWVGLSLIVGVTVLVGDCVGV